LVSTAWQSASIVAAYARCCSANWAIAHRATNSGMSTSTAANACTTGHSAAMIRPSTA
jgi:hypothetical protein